MLVNVFNMDLYPLMWEYLLFRYGVILKKIVYCNIFVKEHFAVKHSKLMDNLFNF